MFDSDSPSKLNRRGFLRFIAAGAALASAGALTQALTPVQASAPQTQAASTEANKALVRRYIEQVVNAGHVEALDDFYAPNCKRYLSAKATPLSPGGQKQRLTGLQAAFPNLQFYIEDLTAEDDRVAYRGTVRAVQQGAFQGIERTLKSVMFSAIEIVRIENGKFVEHWGGPDTFDLLQQLGAVVSATPETKKEQGGERVYARVSLGQFVPGKMDDAIAIFRDSVVPAAKQLIGYKGAYMLADRQNNKSIIMTFWDTEASMTAGEASGFYQQQVAKFKDVLAAPPVREAHEVCVQG